MVHVKAIALSLIIAVSISYGAMMYQPTTELPPRAILLALKSKEPLTAAQKKFRAHKRRAALARHKAAILKAERAWFRAIALNRFLTALAALPRSRALVAVKAQLGKPYVYAAAGPNAFDCSGLTMFAWASGGLSIPHNAAAQFGSERHVDEASLTPGDLVFFGSPIHHVGMYVGNGQMIEAPHSGSYVRYASINRPDYAGASSPT